MKLDKNWQIGKERNGIYEEVKVYSVHSRVLFNITITAHVTLYISVIHVYVHVIMCKCTLQALVVIIHASGNTCGTHCTCM